MNNAIKRPVNKTKKINTGVHSLYVGNLNYTLDESHILSLFKTYGFIKNIKIMREGKENKSRGFAFVDMVVYEDAKKAIEKLDKSSHYGRTLNVRFANTQNFKQTKDFNQPNN